MSPRVLFLLLTAACSSESHPPVAQLAPASSGSGGSSGAMVPPGGSLDVNGVSCSVPDTLHVTVTGYSKCTCLNGTFTLARATSTEWGSVLVTGCPGQTKPAQLKFTTQHGAEGFGVTSDNAVPGSGNSDYAPVDSVTCSPLHIRGGGSQAGNITTTCPSVEDSQMQWTIVP